MRRRPFPSRSSAAAVGAAAALALLPGEPGTVGAQEEPAVDPSDVATVDAAVTTLYDVISGPAGEARDWNRFRALFADGGRLVIAGARPDGSTVHRTMTPEQYIERAGPGLVENGFYETEIGGRTERFGPIAHRFSTYESRQRPDDPEPLMRGINSIQLLHDGERWRILSVFWTSERPDLEIPERYIGEP